MEDFKVWFCLKDRLNFTIDPQVNTDDARYYFGRSDIKERLQKQIRRAFIAPGVPKLMAYGPYGSGKTQTLFYLDYYLKTSPPNSLKETPHTLYLTVEMRSNSTASHLHMQLMEALGKETVARWVRTLFDQTSDWNSELGKLVDDPNIPLALKELRAGGDSSFVAWRWLTGQSLKTTELSGLQLTRNLTEVGAGDLVDTLVAVGNLANQVNQKLIFLVDEFEEVQNVKAGDAAESIHQYLRRLAEPANASVGFLIGFKADTFDDAPPVLQRGDVVGRIGRSNYLEIPFLPAVADVRSFVTELLKNLTVEEQVTARINEKGLNSQHGKFPFEPAAFELLADYATQDITRALPRYIINAINECAIQAWDEEMFVINENIVNEVAQFIFA